MPLHGERLDKPSYAILRSLQGGQTAEAYLVDHEIFGRRCVQKTYSTLGLEDTAAFREPRVLHAICHPHVVQVLEAQYDPDYADAEAITFVMIYYEGGSVAALLDQDYRFSLHQALALAVQLLDALAFIHTEFRIIHRDVKPGNVVLDGDYSRLYLGDFGSAAEMEADGSVASIQARTPLYTPPEAGPITGRVGVAGDLYSAGMTLFEMLNGPLPYARIDPEQVDRRLARAQRALADRAFMFEPHVPEPLRTVVRKALRPNPPARFQSASDFIAALRTVRCIDWLHVQGRDLEGTWEGTWPPHLPVHRRRHYRVTSRILGSGSSRGRRRLEAFQATAGRGALARFGVHSATVDADDREAVERFFRAVATRAAHLVPAR